MTSNSRSASVDDRLAVGSSKMSTRASAESARAMAISCRSAGPMSAKSRSSGSEKPARSAISAARRRIERGRNEEAGAAVGETVEQQRLGDGEAGRAGPVGRLVDGDDARRDRLARRSGGHRGARRSP